MNITENPSWIKLFRKIEDWRWYKDGNTFRVFVHLLLEANYKDHDFENITVHRGEVVASYETIGLALNLSVQNVRTAISHLKSTGELTASQHPKYQVFKLLNYDLYQENQQANQQATNSQLTGNQQATNNNIRNKEYKEEKERKENNCPVLPVFNGGKVENSEEDESWVPELDINFHHMRLNKKGVAVTKEEVRHILASGRIDEYYREHGLQG